ncbi:hypothetical protein [Massilia sp. CFBP9026]|uniref:hypothetical protein n=1 Tax=Massilia sp. CFBP9026 TaxID=3096536 RepID=UPI002A69C748|nr:hypothetical protein [Massilia sp. CFBP9026]MDY0962939.1 hypothetical protein [Massilia sp. CFBP9026]
MKKILVLCLLASAMSGASASGPFVAKECMRRCAEVSPIPEHKAWFDQKMAELRQKKSQETDPKALKRLTEEEEDLLADLEDKGEQFCSHICEE